MKKITPFIIAISILVSFCSKRSPKSYGQFTNEYSCMGIMPVNNESTIRPSSELLGGYLSIEMYRNGFEVLDSESVEKIYSDGKVYFPKRFTKSLALEYSTLLGLDGIIYGSLSTPNKAEVVNGEELLDLELHFMDVKSSNIVWSHSQRIKVNIENYNEKFKKLSAKVFKDLVASGLKYDVSGMPCWDAELSNDLKKLPDLARENFNSLTYDLAEADEESVFLHLGNVFMSLGKRNLALTQYQHFLKSNPASPFKMEVERQVAVLKENR